MVNSAFIEVFAPGLVVLGGSVNNAKGNILPTLALSGVTSVAAHATLATLSGGSALVSGTVANGGTLFATGLGSLIEIASGGVVNGGVALIGDGIVDIAGSSGESVRFLSSGSGGLEIADTKGHASAFSGRVSGFGGSGHSNHEQFIDLVSVTSAPNTISLSYVSAASHTSGTLFVSSGGAVVAQINMIGAYTSANFSTRADGSGNVEIFDPTVVNGGSVEPGPAQTSRGTASICRTSPSARRRRSPIRRTAPIPAAR